MLDWSSKANIIGILSQKPGKLFKKDIASQHARTVTLCIRTMDVCIELCNQHRLMKYEQSNERVRATRKSGAVTAKPNRVYNADWVFSGSNFQRGNQ